MRAEKGAALLAEEILSEAKREADRIIREARHESETILGSAKITAKERWLQITRETESEGARMRDQILAEGRMRARREFLQKREQLIEQGLQEIRRALQKYVSSAEYSKYLLKLAERTCKELGSDKVVLRANKRDTKILEKKLDEISKKTGKEVSLGKPISAIGGIRAETPDGLIVADETLDSLLRREQERLRVEIAKALFEGA